jgi:S-adenosylmethionine:tRNA ribosyltransferase-isomerase
MADADLYDYELPPDLIAQESLADRAAARLLVVDRATAAMKHRHVRDLPQILRAGDLVIVNDTRVVPARLVGRRVKTGGRWEGLFLRVDAASGAWELLASTRGRPEIGERVMLTGLDGLDALTLTLVGRSGGGAWLAVPDVADPLATVEEILNRVGRVPLPGYIRGGAEQPGDRERYQTVFARQSGSAAAPTAGLHFTDSLLAELAACGIGRASVTLHVGLDTFRPISAERLDDHPMHTEWCECPAETVAAIRETRGRGGRIVAVGTTAARTLETAARSGTLAAWSGPTDLFIRPGFEFRAIDCLLTNFHMPRTTLMVLVSTFASRGLIATAYEEAIRQRYRFLSYGDAMLIQ